MHASSDHQIDPSKLARWLSSARWLVWVPLRAWREHLLSVRPLRAQKPHQPPRPSPHAFREHRTSMGAFPLSHLRPL